MDFLKRVLRILWKRRLVVILAPVCVGLGAFTVMLTLPPQYEAVAKVQLDIVKPNPVTGFHVNSKNVESYITSQRQMIHDYQVTVRAATDLGWLDSPELQSQFAASGAEDQGIEFGRWVAARIGGGMLVSPVPETNILAIRFRGASPDLARTVAEAVRNAYIEVTLDAARGAAAGSAAAQQQQAELARAKLLALENEKSQFERATGIMIQHNNVDTESAVLNAMSDASLNAGRPVVPTGPSVTANQLASLESSLEAASKTFGPNNPMLIALKQRKAVLEGQLARERSGANSTASAILNAQRLSQSQLSGQMSKVIGQRSDLMKLRLIQDQIDIWRQRFDMFTHGAQEQAQLANLATTTVSPVGETDAPKSPVFPNKPLIVGGALGLGAAFGVLLALFLEMLSRRVRVASDLRSVSATISLRPVPLVDLPTEAPKTLAGRVPKVGAPRPREPKAVRGKWKLARA